MRGNTDRSTPRHDLLLRVVMWLDAFLSAALALICLVASPVVAMLGVPGRILFGLGVAAIVCGVLLAAFGAVTAVALMLRMRAGHYYLPPALRLPLPAPMRPDLRTPGWSGSRT